MREIRFFLNLSLTLLLFLCVGLIITDVNNMKEWWNIIAITMIINGAWTFVLAMIYSKQLELERVEK